MEGMMYLPFQDVSGNDYGAETVPYGAYSSAYFDDTTTDIDRPHHHNHNHHHHHHFEKHLGMLEKTNKGFDRHLILEGAYPGVSALDLSASLRAHSHPDYDRTRRYVSPSGPFGGDVTTASDTGSSPGEDWSPQLQFSSVSQHSSTSSPQTWTASSSSDIPISGRSFWTSDHSNYSGIEHTHQSGAYPQAAVIPQETQHYPDPGPEPLSYENTDSIRLTSQPQHLKLLTNQLTSSEDSSDDGDESTMPDPEDSKDADYTPSSNPRRRTPATTSRSPTLSRRAPSRRTTLPTEPPTRIAKSTNSPTTKRKSKGRKPTATPTASTAVPLAPPPRPFICPFAVYGCPSTFTAKNEWKRHISSQHLQLGFYRCDIGACNPDNHPAASPYSTSRTHNDFNRKDLFTQHLRRMHRRVGVERADFERELDGIRGRCWVRRREGPSGVQCEGCARSNSGWEEWVECLGGHVEKDGFKINVGEYGTALKEWAIREGVVGQTDNGRLALWGSKGMGSNGGGMVGGDEDAEGEDE